MTIWEKMQKLDRRVLYAVLIVVVSAGLFFKFEIPTDPDPSSKDLYAAIQELPDDSTVIIQSDWTNSTRGESMGHFEALIRMLMDKNIKFVFYSAADPVAPQVARTVIARLNDERGKENLKVYQVGEDYIDLGYFANAEATNTSMGTDLRNAWKGKTTKMPNGDPVDIFASPVLKNIKSIGDAGMFISVTASSSLDVAVQRLSDKVKMGAMVTGVMGPSALPYYQAKQLKGVAVGLKGVYDMEYMMKYGIAKDGTEGAKVTWGKNAIPAVTEGMSFDRGAKYYGTLHLALILLILAVIIGNVAMFASRKRKVTA